MNTRHLENVMLPRAMGRVMFALLMMLPAIAPAAVITQSIGFNSQFPNSSFTKFNSGLGTLTDVDIFLTGNASVTLQPSIFNPTGLAPMSYPFTIGLAQHVVVGGLGLLPTDGGRYIINSTSDGTGTPVVLSLQFTYDIHFNATSDLSGTASVSTSGFTIPPALATGQLNNFVGPPIAATFLPFALLIGQDPSVSVVSPVPVNFSSDNQGGALIVTYTYTSVPEPASTVMLLAIVPMLQRRTRRSRH